MIAATCLHCGDLALETSPMLSVRLVLSSGIESPPLKRYGSLVGMGELRLRLSLDVIFNVHL